MASRYAGRNDGEAIEALSAKLADSLRDAIRDLSLAPPLSEHWLSSSEKLLRVANVSEMEKRLKKEGAPESTLWEGEELALRYLLEDGKLNLTLRLLDQYVDWLADRGKTLTAAEALPCAKFEFGICITLSNVWMHREALQTTDMPLLCHTLQALLQWGISGAPSAASVAVSAGSPLTFPPARSLTSVGLRFLLPLSRLMDGMHERKVVAEVLRSNVFELAVRFVDARGGAEAEPGDLLAGLEGLAGIVSSEEFTTQKAKALPSSEGVAACARLKDALLDRLTADDLALRRKLRPLIDFSIECARRVK